jgi:hypothetical protein
VLHAGRSAESDRVAEAFVKTFERDYVLLNAGSDATTAMTKLDRWFEDRLQPCAMTIACAWRNISWSAGSP